MMPFNFFGGFMFTVVPILMLGAFIFIAYRAISQWKYNNSQPELTVQVKAVSKRIDVSHSTNSIDQNNINHQSSSTAYYVTFEVESGDRMEFNIGGAEYGLLVEGDTGKLTFQGTRYLGFNRDSV